MKDEKEFNSLPKEAQEELLKLEALQKAGAFDFLYEKHSNQGSKCPEAEYDPMKNADAWSATFSTAYA